MIRTFLVLCCLLAPSLSFAVAVPLESPPVVGGTSGARVAKPGFVLFDGAYNNGLKGTVGGRPIVVPASWRLAANAGQFAVGAVRGSPALLGAAVLAWLLSQGIEYIDGQFFKKEQDDSPVSGRYWYQTGYSNRPCHGEGSQCTFTQAMAAIDEALQSQFWAYRVLHVGDPITDGYKVVWENTQNGRQYDNLAIYFYGEAPASRRPATDEDFAPLAASLPDAAANELIDKGLAVPLSPPEVAPIPQKVPLSDPYLDPVTGDYVRDVAVVTPQPSDPENAEADHAKEPVDPETGDPITDPVTGDPKPPKEQDDFCKVNPDAMACWKVGDPENVDFDKDERTIQITPQSGWGPDGGSCPPPLRRTVNGKTVEFSYEHVCTTATTFRPAVIGVAWFSALGIMFGMYRKGNE